MQAAVHEEIDMRTTTCTRTYVNWCDTDTRERRGSKSSLARMYICHMHVYAIGLCPAIYMLTYRCQLISLNQAQLLCHLELHIRAFLLTPFFDADRRNARCLVSVLKRENPTYGKG